MFNFRVFILEFTFKRLHCEVARLQSLHSEPVYYMITKTVLNLRFSDKIRIVH